MKIFAENRKALFDYEILEKFQAGMELFGFEVKAIRQDSMNLDGSYVVIRGGEAYLLNVKIPPYQSGNTPEKYEPDRTRKLLLKKSEIKYLFGKSEQKGLTLVPLKVYDIKNKIKLEFGIGRGKKKFEKREKIKQRETEREIRRTLKS